jgi:hypothetical protein
VSWDNLKVSVRLARSRLLISPTTHADFRRWKTGRCLFATHALRKDWYVDPPGEPGVCSSNARVSVFLILVSLFYASPSMAGTNPTPSRTTSRLPRLYWASLHPTYFEREGVVPDAMSSPTRPSVFPPRSPLLCPLYEMDYPICSPPNISVCSQIVRRHVCPVH